MLEIVFTEFTNLVERNFGLEVMEDILKSSELNSKGIYTEVGNYDYTEVLLLVTHLSERVNVPAQDIVKGFGIHLLSFFSKKYSVFFKECDNSIQFLKMIDCYIHREVRKLYPEAELPVFTFLEDGDRFVLMYESTRPFALLAEGLIMGTIDYYHDNLNLETVDKSEGQGTKAHFILSKG